MLLNIPHAPRLPCGGLSVDLWCNHVSGGWTPGDLETGLGGSEECIVLWAGALAAAGHRVRVYHNAPGGRPRHNGHGRGAVSWLPHDAFDPFALRDVLVSWKSAHPWRVGATARRRIHWSSDVEPAWPPAMLARLHAFVALTPFHRSALPWLPQALARIVPHGVDLGHLQRLRTARVPGRMLYASSPDRGLKRLLDDWPRLRAIHPELTLRVTYGWRRFEACTQGLAPARAFQARLRARLRQPGVEDAAALSRDEMARAYWQAEYWALPLPRAESELFCLNAVKAMHAGALGVVCRIGALRDTVTRWVDYDEFLAGSGTPRNAAGIAAMDWSVVVRDHWEPLFRDE